jgi:hypothetical protein
MVIFEMAHESLRWFRQILSWFMLVNAYFLVFQVSPCWFRLEQDDSSFSDDGPSWFMPFMINQAISSWLTLISNLA